MRVIPYVSWSALLLVGGGCPSPAHPLHQPARLQPWASAGWRLQGEPPEGWKARRLVVAADLVAPLAEKFGVGLATLCTLK